MPPFSLHRLTPMLALAVLLASAQAARAQVPTPLPPPGKTAKPTKVTVAQYRAQRVGARDALAALAKRSGGGARDATKILKALDKPQIVTRADGAAQKADGTRWSALSAGVAPGGATEDYDIKALQRDEVRRLQRDIEAEIAQIDAWDARTDGAYYQPVDAGAIMKDLEKTGQIRTGPTWWQARVQAAKKWLGEAIGNFFKWIGSLFPAGGTGTGGALPNLSWLVFVFWAIVASLLAYLLFAAYRAFAGNIRWGGRRKKPSGDEELQGADAELLLLPPDELGARAAQFAREGNFREALRHRYIAMLLRLDGRGVWRYDTRRTNWEHIAALRRGALDVSGGNADIVAPLTDLTRRFDRVRYGGAPCDGADWDEFERDANELEARAGGAVTAGAAR